jgi:hypothetical protein
VESVSFWWCCLCKWEGLATTLETTIVRSIFSCELNFLLRCTGSPENAGEGQVFLGVGRDPLHAIQTPQTPSQCTCTQVPPGRGGSLWSDYPPSPSPAFSSDPGTGEAILQIISCQNPRTLEKNGQNEQMVRSLKVKSQQAGSIAKIGRSLGRYSTVPRGLGSTDLPGPRAGDPPGRKSDQNRLYHCGALRPSLPARGVNVVQTSQDRQDG